MLASRVCDEWNYIVSAGTVNVFKMRLDHHLRNVRFMYYTGNPVHSSWGV